MHFIDQDLSGLNQLGAIVGEISGYLCGKQFRQLCLTVDWQIICGEEKVCEWEISQQCTEIRREKNHPVVPNNSDFTKMCDLFIWKEATFCKVMVVFD